MSSLQQKRPQNNYGAIPMKNGQINFPVPAHIQAKGPIVDKYDLNELPNPVRDIVILKRLSSYKGALTLPESLVKAEQVALVVKAGPGVYTQNGDLIKPDCKPGDKVFLPEKADTVKIVVQDEEYIMIRDGQILGIFPQAPATSEADIASAKEILSTE